MDDRICDGCGEWESECICVIEDNEYEPDILEEIYVYG